MVNSTPDLDKATVDIEKFFIENTWDVVVPDVVPSCLWMGDRTNRNVLGFNIEHNPPSLRMVDPVNIVRYLIQVFVFSIMQLYST